MSITDQIQQIAALRDKALVARDRAAAAAEKYGKEAEEYETAIAVLMKLSPSNEPVKRLSAGDTLKAFVYAGGSIASRILELMRQSEKLWWTANEIQDALGAAGDEVKMTSISPTLTRLKEGGDIVRDDLKVALADRVSQNTEGPEDDLLGRNSPEPSKDHGVTDRGTQPSSLVKPWAGGGT